MKPIPPITDLLLTINLALLYYRFFRDELGAEFIQFIPLIERVNDDGLTVIQSGNQVTERLCNKGNGWIGTIFNPKIAQ